ncbi:patatin-like phospholipase family protein [Bdellovibrio bacteriovorus]|uniref:Alpha-beta hydrolase superfamily protein n=1 Tax=Bdellovibrio bacteriovorus str. Tiberius TaxID=1069642 RepID=K7ZFQ6_BDEBC|nr:patatin-like phospholipase family protein [Bdellovibrio bacteriovorus]AFY01732.1 alpha-beta hydrolase superfamily protein [Bdellovibrio bacteriovorus str. Tiberius]
MPTLGLVLSGGGARGAYQAGVLAAIAHICSRHQLDDPFQVYSGVSAGAINVALLAGNPSSFVQSSKNLVNLWSKIDSDNVFYADLMALSRGGLQWMTEFSLGGGKKDSGLRSLLSTHPLHNYILSKCQFAEIQRKINAGILRAVSVSALDYDSVSTVSFFQGIPDLKTWERGMHRSEKVNLSVEHIMASSAIPMLFPPVKVQDRYYGDGCIRNQSPCGPAIYLGASRLLAVGVRRRQDTFYSYHHASGGEMPTVARVANVLMNAVMMDGLESDIQRIQQINEGLKGLNSEERHRSNWHELETLWISPSVDFSELAKKKGSELPRIIRYLLRGPGSVDESAELLSYLMFTPSYCRQLIDIGFSDGMKEQDKIADFFARAQEEAAVVRPRKISGIKG